ncbi:hypothetical protein VJI77_07790, partial [Parvimonas sp. D2]
RSGSTETVQLRFINKFTKFADLAGGDFSAMNEGPRFSNQGSGEFIGSFENQGGARTFGSKVNQQTQAPPGDFGSFST